MYFFTKFAINSMVTYFILSRVEWVVLLHSLSLIYLIMTEAGCAI